jgi:hypothetical protein
VGTVTVLLGVLIVAAIGLCGTGIWAFIEGVKTARSMRVLTDDLDSRVVPLLDKADVTVDAINAELLRVDGIVTRFEDVAERVESTTRTVQEVANAPAEIVNDIADRVRRAWKTRHTPPAEDYGSSRHKADDQTTDAGEQGDSQPASTMPTSPATL